MRKEGLPPPRFEELAGSFRVTLFGNETEQGDPIHPDLSAYRELDLNPRQELALNHLLKNKRITNRDYQELCSEVHPETLRRDLADLVSRGVIIKVGDKRATYYILK
jgi:ATP-dependent DNA helicase RecG